METRCCRRYLGPRRGAYRLFDGGKLTEIDHWEDLDLDVAIILKWIFNEYDGDMNWIDVVQDRNMCRILVNTVMNLRIP